MDSYGELTIVLLMVNGGYNGYTVLGWVNSNNSSIGLMNILVIEM